MGRGMDVRCGGRSSVLELHIGQHLHYPSVVKPFDNGGVMKVLADGAAVRDSVGAATTYCRCTGAETARSGWVSCWS